MKPLTVLVDTPTSEHPVTQLLRDKGAQVVQSNLKVEQMRVTDRCGIWFLTGQEFAHHIGDKSIYRRVNEFKRAVPEPIVLVEGNPMDFRNGVSGPAIRSAIAFVTLTNRIPVLIGEDTAEVAELIYVMANQAQNGMGMSIGESKAAEEPTAPAGGNGNGNGSNGNGHRPKDLAELQEYILESLPDVGPSTAKALLKKYGSLRAVFGATSKDLTRIPGIGPKKAKRLAAFLSGTTS